MNACILHDNHKSSPNYCLLWSIEALSNVINCWWALWCTTAVSAFCIPHQISVASSAESIPWADALFVYFCLTYICMLYKFWVLPVRTSWKDRLDKQSIYWIKLLLYSTNPTSYLLSYPSRPFPYGCNKYCVVCASVIFITCCLQASGTGYVHFIRKVNYWQLPIFHKYAKLLKWDMYNTIQKFKKKIYSGKRLITNKSLSVVEVSLTLLC